jgi:CubicO group peptidase (beta-lactamase class C family)
MDNLIAKTIFTAIKEKVFPGCVVGYINANGDFVILPFGKYTYEESSYNIEIDSIFDVASITKAIPTSCLALKFIDEGKLKLNTKIIEYIPEFENSYKDEVTIWHLLTHTLDFNISLASLKDKGANEIINSVLKHEFKYAPGKVYNYCNATSILLGIVIERLTGENIAYLAKKEFFDPLKMESTTFFPAEVNFEKIVPTEIDLWRNRIIKGEVHDESAFVLREKIIAGSAGLFSTAKDILIFLKMLLNDGEFDGKRYFSKEIIYHMCSNQIEYLNLSAGLGWELNQKRYMGDYCSNKTIGKTGFTGCVCICDLEKKKAMVLLSNYTYPQRKKTKEPIDKVRRDIANIIFSN